MLENQGFCWAFHVVEIPCRKVATHIILRGSLQGLADFPLQGIKLEEVYLEAQKRYKCDFVYVEARNVEPPPCQRGWDSQNKRGLLESWFWTQRKLVAILGFPDEWL